LVALYDLLCGEWAVREMGYVQFFTAIRAKCFIVIAENDVSPFFDRFQTLMAFPRAFVPYLNRDPQAGHSLFTVRLVIY
jgi:hypothetical protein